MKYSEIHCIICQQYQEEYLNVKIKITEKICAIIRSNHTLHIKPPARLRAQLNKTSDHVIHLVKEIGYINKNKTEQKNYFLCYFFQLVEKKNSDIWTNILF